MLSRPMIEGIAEVPMPIIDDAFVQTAVQASDRRRIHRDADQWHKMHDDALGATSPHQRRGAAEQGGGRTCGHRGARGSWSVSSTCNRDRAGGALDLNPDTSECSRGG